MAEPSLQLGNGNWAGKSGNLLGYHKVVGNFYADELTFTRASTGTIVNAEGLIESVASGIPRVDYLNNANGSLLLEGQRTNLVTYSEDFSNAAWTKSANLVLTNTYLSPTGDNNAYSLGHDGTTAEYQIFKSVTLPSSNITLAVFVKKGTKDWVALRIGGITIQYFNINTNTLGNSVLTPPISTSFENYSDGWVKISMTVLGNGAANNIQIYAAQSSSSASCTGTNGDKLIYAFGAQLEQGSYSTSYIPTSGTTATRLQDTSSTTGLSSVINSTEGVLYAEVSAFVGANEDRQISISDGGTSNRVVMALLSNGTQIQFVVASGGSITVNTTQTISTITSGTKIAFAYKANDFKIYANGLLIASDTSGAVPTGMDTLGFDRGDGNDNFYGNVQNLQIFKTALTDTELATLTTI